MTSAMLIKFSRERDIEALRNAWQIKANVMMMTQTGDVLSYNRCIAEGRRKRSSGASCMKGSGSAVKALDLLSSRMTWNEDVMTAMSKFVNHRSIIMMPAPKKRAAKT